MGTPRHFVLITLVVTLVTCTSVAHADVPTWDPEPTDDESLDPEPTDESAEAVPREEQTQAPTEPTWFDLYGAGGDFNRLGAPELVFAPSLELGAVQAFHGFAAGTLLCFASDGWCDDNRHLAMAGGGMALGIGGSVAAHYLLDLAPGQVAAINTGMIWGYHLGLILFIADPGFPQGAATFIVPGLGGMALGALAGTGLRLTAGDLAMINLGGILGSMTLIAIDTFSWRTGAYDFLIRNELNGALFLMATAAVGGVVAWQYPMDRFRVRLVGAGGILTGITLSFFAYFAGASDGAALATLGLGTLAGIGTLGYLTRGFDAHFRSPPILDAVSELRPGLAPTLDGRGTTFSLTGRF